LKYGLSSGQGIDNKLSLELCEYEIQTILLQSGYPEEVLVNTLAGWVPTFSLGLALRDLLYRTIINRIGTSVYIEDGAEFWCCWYKIGNEVDIYRDVRLDARGQSKICIADQVALNVALISE